MQAGVELSDRGHRQDQEMSTRGFDQSSHGNGVAANVTKALVGWSMARLGIFIVTARRKAGWSMLAINSGRKEQQETGMKASWCWLDIIQAHVQGALQNCLDFAQRALDNIRATERVPLFRDL